MERETLPDLVADGAVAAYLEDGYWLDIGTLEAYTQAQEDMANSTYASPALPRTIRPAEQNWPASRVGLPLKPDFYQTSAHLLVR